MSSEPMNSVAAIQRICNLPVQFRKGGKSPQQLVHDAGIDPSTLTHDEVSAVLKSKPELVSDWLRWSEDKRGASGYYFSEGKAYVVGYYPGDDQLEFTDPIAACADFVIKEVNAVW